MTELKKDFEDALFQDLGRTPFWTELAEVMQVQEYANHHLEHIDDYVQDIDIDPSIIWAPSSSKIRYEPLGVALVMGSWNFPLFVTLKPLITCIASGNCAIVKPSELGPCCSKVLQILVEKYLDNRCFRVVQGGVDVCIKLTSSKFDIICFTGSTEKGKLVARAAATNLVPCILELGGKCPVVLDQSTDLDFAAMKVCYGKF